MKHKIDTESKVAIRQQLRMTPVHLEDTMNQHIDDMLERNVTEKSSVGITSLSSMQKEQHYKILQ